MLPNLSKSEFNTLTKDASILQKDGFGLKVLHLADSRILKLFRRKRLLSSQIWAPHACRFQKNAKILRQRGIHTITVESVFNIPELKRQAVFYHALPGTTLRQWLSEHEGAEALTQIEAFARFVATLHAQGILFRSLHLGNVLVKTDGELALIDIVDIGFRWFGPLNTNQRIRNFKHIGRYKEDCALIAKAGQGPFMSAYLKTAHAPHKVQLKLINAFQESCS